MILFLFILKASEELARLRNICRASGGILLRNSRELLGCETDEEKVERIRELLKGRGMEGK